MEIRTILVPLDGSEISERALTPAAEFAERFGARLVLMQVIPTLASVAAQTAAGNPQATAYVDPGEVHEAQRETAREQMEAARSRAGPRPPSSLRATPPTRSSRGPSASTRISS